MHGDNWLYRTARLIQVKVRTDEKESQGGQVEATYQQFQAFYLITMAALIPATSPFSTPANSREGTMVDGGRCGQASCRAMSL